MKLTLISFLILCGCLHGQYRVVVPGTGNKQAFIAENPTKGVYGTCYDMRTADPSSGVLHDAGQVCGLFDATGYGNARVTVQTVTGDSVFQTNTTFKSQGQIIGDVSGPSWYTPPSYYTDIVSSGNQAHAVLDGNTGTNLIFRNGGRPSGNQVWDLATGTAGGQSALFFRVLDDAHSSQFTWLQIVRSGNSISSVTFPEKITTEGIGFDADNSYDVGTGTVGARNLYASGLALGRSSAIQGTLAVNNTSAAGPFQMSGTSGIATAGADVAVGYVFGASSIYPINSSVQLGYSGARYQKVWVTDIDISGTCTGCTAGANQSLSNLTNPTAINQDLFTIGKNIHVQDGSGHDLVELQNAGTVGNIIVSDNTGTVKVILNAFGVDVQSGLSYNVGGLTGFTGTKTAGACTLTITGGVITNVTGC
jgi:hypothetical protein